ncbi:MAG: DMT family transporter, partial [Pseudomonadota bacterium]
LDKFEFTPARGGVVFAWIGMSIYAASNSIATLLVRIGSVNPLADGSNAITFSNLFLLGSLISLIPMWFLFQRDLTRDNLRTLNLADYALLTLAAFLSSALTPGLFFFALEHSSVTNVVLISRIEPILFLIAAWAIMKERINLRVLVAGLIAFAGAALIISMRVRDEHCMFDLGEFAAVAGTLSYVASALVARKSLQRIPMGVFSIYRSTVGIVLFFVMVSVVQGPQEFQNILAPIMFRWIWLYALVVIVAAQFVWFFALKYARSTDISLATSVSPLVSILFAMLILGEAPGPGLLPGAALILVAVCVAQSNKKIVGLLIERAALDLKKLQQGMFKLGVRQSVRI